MKKHKKVGKRGIKTKSKTKKVRSKKINSWKTKAKIKEIIDTRVPFGIPELDKAIEGGLERRSVNMVAGSAGSGKSILCAQFIVNGAKMYNEKGVYICFEEKRERFFSHMLKFGWDLDALEKKKMLVFLEYTPEQVKTMIEEGGGLIESTITKLNAKRVVIDSISAFSILFKDDVAKKEAALALFELLRSWNVTSLVTGEFDEQSIEKQDAGELEFEVDSVILLYYIKEQNIRKRALEFLKMRGTNHAKRIYSMRITDKGIKIFPGEPVF